MGKHGEVTGLGVEVDLIMERLTILWSRRK